MDYKSDNESAKNMDRDLVKKEIEQLREMLPLVVGKELQDHITLKIYSLEKSLAVRRIYPYRFNNEKTQIPKQQKMGLTESMICNVRDKVEEITKPQKNVSSSFKDYFNIIVPIIGIVLVFGLLGIAHDLLASFLVGIVVDIAPIAIVIWILVKIVQYFKKN